MDDTEALLAAVREALATKRVVVTEIPGGHIVEAARRKARLKFHLYPGEYINCVHLSSPGKQAGWLEDCNRMAEEVLGGQFGAKGVEMRLTEPGGRTEGTLTKYAPYELVDEPRGIWRWTFDG